MNVNNPEIKSEITVSAPAFDEILWDLQATGVIVEAESRAQLYKYVRDWPDVGAALVPLSEALSREFPEYQISLECPRRAPREDCPIFFLRSETYDGNDLRKINAFTERHDELFAFGEGFIGVTTDYKPPRHV